MADVADETAYYLNPKIAAVALVAEGVRFPAGNWLWVADASETTSYVEETVSYLLPQLNVAALTFTKLASEADVAEFERMFP
jgi:hypothetical protein